MSNEAYTIPQSVNTIIWDFDGTILNSLGISIEIWRQVLPRHGFEAPSDSDIAHNYHGTLEETARGLAPLASDDQIAQLLESFLEIDNVYIQDADHYLYDDAVELAKRAHLNGMRQILVTNRIHGTNRGNASPRTLIEHSRLREYITEIISGDEVTERKPSKQALAGVLEVASNPVVIGDQFVDAQFAANLGCVAILVHRHPDEMVHQDKITDMDANNIKIVTSLKSVLVNYKA